MKKITAILLSIIMLFTVLPLTVFAETDTGYIECTSAKKHHTFSGNAKLDSNGNRLLLCETCGQYSTAKTGDYYMYGTYPQSEVTDDTLKTKLSDLAGDTAGWASYNYYVSNKQSDFMKYTDIDYDGETYRGVYFTHYRPSYTSADENNGSPNGYRKNKIHWFKYDPIIWQILSFNLKTGVAVVLSKHILDSQQYSHYNYERRTIDNKTVYSNNYVYSDIRLWLNDIFYDTAFKKADKSMITKTTLDNGLTLNEEYNSDSPEDNVWLLSYSEAQDSTYGLDTKNSRKTTETKYAKSQGFSYSWHLRTAGEKTNRACTVEYGSPKTEKIDTEDTYVGVRPALTLQIPYEISITYKLDDGRFVDDYTEPTSYLSNETFTPPAADKMVKVGYTFAGWTLTTDMNTAKEYTANWTANTYNISYELNDGINTTANPATYTYGVGVAELLSPTRDGYTFVGWTLDGNAVTAISTTQFGNITLTAQWEEIPVEPDDSDDDSSGGVRMFYWLKWLLEFLNKLMTKMFNVLGWAC